MARKRKHAEHVNHERWLVSYADFITLLFAFFVVMFAASNADKKKAGQIAHAVQVAFNELAIFSPTGKVVALTDEAGLSSEQNVMGSANAALSGTEIVATTKKEGEGDSEMAGIRKQLEEILKNELADQSVRISLDERGLIISLSEAGFFAPGSAVMQAHGVEVVNRIAAKLLTLDNQLRVEGHTDNTPIHTAQFPSNWELSTARATYVLQHLIAKTSFPPTRLSAVGYGEYRPVAPNNTPAGRASNRRVDLVVIGSAAQKLEPK